MTTYNDDISNITAKQLEKENYIANMLVDTLYSNDVDYRECRSIIELFAKKVFGMYTNVTIE